MTGRIGVFPLAALLTTGLLVGCDAGHTMSAADKAGGSGAPVVLRLADSGFIDQPDAPAVQYFATQVATLSGGSLRVHVVFGAAGDKVPDIEPQTARLVREGRFDLGWIGARAWDELGVKSLQALQAPFLITDSALLGRVTTSPLARQMLAGLESQNVIGLALVPVLLRHPVGLGRPLASLADFAGERVRVIPSRATDALMTALGAVPVHVSNSAIPDATAHHRIDRAELMLGNAPGGSIVTGNVTFFGTTVTLFAGRHAFEPLTDEQQGMLLTSAERTLRHVVATHSTESGLARQLLRRQRSDRAREQARPRGARARRAAGLRRARARPRRRRPTSRRSGS
jgi:TRAP-type C4-dicarboxylate transport system substrate-binding protein